VSLDYALSVIGARAATSEDEELQNAKRKMQNAKCKTKNEEDTMNSALLCDLQ
jgi:hypothetical protein